MAGFSFASFEPPVSWDALRVCQYFFIRSETLRLSSGGKNFRPLRTLICPVSAETLAPPAFSSVSRDNMTESNCCFSSSKLWMTLLRSIRLFFIGKLCSTKIHAAWISLRRTVNAAFVSSG